MTAICTPRASVVNLAGAIKNVKRRDDQKLTNVILSDHDGNEYWVRVADDVPVPGPLEIGRALCIEYGYLETNRPRRG